MYISYDYYRIFYYVAKYRNFTQAANILMNNQPNITRSIKNLESALGCRLFVRSNRGVTLTPEGEKLYARVSVAMEQIQAGEEELERDTNLQNGIISIGTSEIALHLLLLPVLQAFRRDYPRIRVRIPNYSTTQAIAAVKSGLVDFAVVSTPFSIEKPLKAAPLLKFQDILIGGPSYAFLAERPQRLCELKPYPLVCLGRETQTYVFYNELYLRYGLSLAPDMEVSTMDQVLAMIRCDLGIGFLPENFAAQALREGTVYSIRVREEIPQREVCLIRDASRACSVAAKELERYLSRETTPGKE